MCTAVTYSTKSLYFGRNLDLEYSLGETVTVTPRNFPLAFRQKPTMTRHYALIGVAHVSEGVPLYYDAVNEKGLAVAALSFPGFAKYLPEKHDADNIAPFELIAWVLGQCSDISQAEELLERTNIIKEDFSSELPGTPLHWMISDKTGSLTAEPREGGLQIYRNRLGVLTNSPPFDWHLLNLEGYMGLSRRQNENHMVPGFVKRPYSRGLGAMGLPGDLSSSSRFVRAVFTKKYSVSGPSPEESTAQFFHILASVAQTNGCSQLSKDLYERTVYSVCYDTEKGICYYTTYENSRPTAVDMYKEELEGKTPVSYPLIHCQQVFCQN